MRVRMLKTIEVAETTTHPVFGVLALVLVFLAGSTQHFDPATAKKLVDEQAAEPYPEEPHRVKMLRTVTEPELAALLGTTPAAGAEAHRYQKGELVHFPTEVAKKITEGSDPIAELAEDPAYDPIGATRQEAFDAALARAIEAKEAEQRREAIKQQAKAAVTPAAAKPSKTPSKTPAAPPADVTASTPTEG